MSFTDEEKVLIRHHLGYPSLNQRTGLALGTAGTTQLRFILESAMENMPPASEPKIRQVLNELECIDVEASKVRKSLEVARTGDVHLRGPEALGELDVQYVRWRNKLGDLFDVPVDPFSMETQRLEGGPGVIEPQ